MNKKDRQAVWEKLQWEGGFEYFITGSNFPEIKAKDFRKAIENLRTAWREMEDLLGEPPEE